MNGAQIVKAAIPYADESVIEHVIWGRTPYPFGRISARSIYKAASGFKRAADKGVALCDFCERPAAEGKSLCCDCDIALSQPPIEWPTA